VVVYTAKRYEQILLSAMNKFSFIFTHWRWLLPLLAMGVVTPFTPAWDLAFSRTFFDGEAFVAHPILDGLYLWGVVPAQLGFIVGCVLFAVSFLGKRWQRWRKPGIALVLTLGLGSGLIVNAVLKDHWGRPRPQQVIEFGGSQQFRPYYQPNFFNQPEPSKSFPCGHCSMGYYFFILYFIGKRLKSRTLSWLGMSLAVTLGISLSVTRMALGGHFLSDTLMSGLIMWLTALLVDWTILGEDQNPRYQQLN